MKIGFDAKRIFFNQTGLGNYARTLVQGLNSEFPENEYHLYTPGIRIKEDFLKNESRVIRHFPTQPIERKFPAIWRSGGLLRDLKKDGIELYHGLSNELPKGISSIGIKSVVTIHDLIFLHYPKQYPWFDRQIYKRKFEAAAKQADLVLAISEQTRQDILQAFQVDADKVKVLHINCDEAFKTIRTLKEKEVLKRKYMLTRDFIISVGTIEQRKNHLNLVKAYEKSDLHDTDLLIIGKKGDAFSALESFVKTHGLASRVKFIHDMPFDDLISAYQTAKASAYISTYEGFGLPVLEAMRSGIPVLCSNISSIPEVAGKAAILVDPNSLEEIKNGLNQLVYESQVRKTLLHAAHQQVQQFETAHLNKQLMEFYQHLLK